MGVGVGLVEEVRRGGVTRPSEGFDAEDLIGVHFCVTGSDQGGGVVERPYPPLDGSAGFLVDQIHFVDHDPVGAYDLVDHLVVVLFGAQVVEVAAHMEGVHDGHNAVHLHPVRRLAGEQSLGDRSRIGHPAGLDEEVVGRVGPGQQLKEGVGQVAAHRQRAAYASVGHLHDLLVGGDDQVAVDADLAHLVDNHRDAAAVVGAQDVVDEGGLARAEEPREDGCGGLGAGTEEAGCSGRSGRGRGQGFHVIDISSAASRTASMIFSYPVQRHRFPARASLISSSEGSGL